MQRRHLTILLVILATEIVIRAALIWHAGPMTDQGFYGDDSYMSHQFAATIAAGGSITQAGANSNGFQPLFVFLLVPFYWFLDIYQATVASAILTNAFSIAGSYFLFLILRDVINTRVGLIGMGLWAVSAHLTRVGVNGLETSLANTLMLLVVYLHERSKRAEPSFGVIRGAALGLVAGLALLARMDLGLLLLPLGLDQIRVRFARRQSAALASVVLVGAMTILPWFAWSWRACGTVIPISGAATRTVAQLYGSPTGPSATPAYFPIGQVPGVYYTSNLSHAASYLVCQAPLSLPPHVFLDNRVIACGVWLAVVALFALRAARKGDASTISARTLRTVFVRLWYVWVFALLLSGSYCFYYFAQWHFWRYLTPVTIVLLLPSAVLVDRILARASSGMAGWKVVAALVSISIVTASGRAHAELFGAVDETGIAYRLYHDAIQMRSAFTPDARIGSFESGTLDYFLDRDVFNLDGKTNRRAYQALLDGRMDRLVKHLGLDYVVSSPWLVRDLLYRRGRWAPGELEAVGRLSHNVIIAVNRIEAQSEDAASDDEPG